MKKSDQHELMRLGARSRLLQLQQHIAELYDEFPEEFATPFAPTLLKMDEKPGGNSWPAFTVTSSNGDDAVAAPITKPKRAWSEEARAAIGAATRKRFADAPWGSLIWHKLHDYLRKAPKHTARLTAMAKSLKVSDSSVGSAFVRHSDKFEHLGHGEWRLKKVFDKTAKKVLSRSSAKRGGAHKKAKPHHWGEYHWQKIHDYLLTREERTAPVAELMKDLKIPTAASAITSMMGHKDLFRRSGAGLYSLHKEMPADQRV